ncbi:hypothetical protein GCM10028805_47280 [Spirosoma harenae]
MGFLLNSFNQLEFLSPGNSQQVFSMALKYSAKKFMAELEKAERIFTHGDIKTNEVMMQQMADSYEVVDTLMSLMLQAGRILTPEAMQLMNEDMLATAAKWGVQVEALDS